MYNYFSTKLKENNNLFLEKLMLWDPNYTIRLLNFLFTFLEENNNKFNLSIETIKNIIDLPTKTNPFTSNCILKSTVKFYKGIIEEFKMHGLNEQGKLTYINNYSASFMKWLYKNYQNEYQKLISV
ncbi:hypothetical protein [Spiroplasma endosymbiont of Amphimallon solstitiale]|uniref:hypothetical protein n=1 Tax=Spiroplasma endosymbiont of Amphimallon solstitiale TaxID=3066288 RepID=UPI00313BA782